MTTEPNLKKKEVQITERATATISFNMSSTPPLLTSDPVSSRIKDQESVLSFQTIPCQAKYRSQGNKHEKTLRLK